MAAWRVVFRKARWGNMPQPVVVDAEIFAGEKRIGAATIRPDLPWEGNAHLMGAARDMYVALKNAVICSTPGLCDDCQKMIAAALAKADGWVDQPKVKA